MPSNPTDALDFDAECAVLARLLDPPDAETLPELHALTDSNATPERIDAAVHVLAAVGVLRIDGAHLRASDALKRLDALGVVAL